MSLDGGTGGPDLFTLHNPAGGLFAPTGGITVTGSSNTPGDALENLDGGDAATDVGVYTPINTVQGAGILRHTEGGTVQTITFNGLSPLADTVASATFLVNGTTAGEQINIVDGPVVAGLQTTEVNSGASATFELIDFANKTKATVNGIDGVDTFTVNNPSASVGLTHLILQGGATSGDTVNILTTPALVTTNWVGGSNGLANDTVNLGNSNSVQGLIGPINLENPPSLNAIVVNDQADTTARVVTLSSFAPNPEDSEGNGDVYGKISGLAPADINYEYEDTGSLVINGGTGGGIGDTFNINMLCRAPSRLPPPSTAAAIPTRSTSTTAAWESAASINTTAAAATTRSTSPAFCPLARLSASTAVPRRCRPVPAIR